MKAFLFALTTSLLFISANAQNCSGYYYMKNSKVEMTMYDPKGKDNGKVIYTTTDAQQSGKSMSANFTSEVLDKKGKQASKGTGKFKCENGVLFLDAKMSMPSEQSSAYKDTEVKGEDAFIEYPSSLSLNQTLKDGHYRMRMYKKDELFATMSMDMTNRKVVAKESITTTAGTWECWKITFESKFRMEMGGIGIPMKFEVAEWFAPGFGIVKTETYKGGKVMGSSAITSYTK